MSQDRFDRLVATHHGEVLRYLVRVTGRRSDADDLSQDVFLRALKGMGSLPLDANVRGWLFTIATNLARNHFRSEARRKRSHAIAGEGDPVDRGSPDSTALRREAFGEIEAAIARLPYRQRLAFTLRKFHDLDYGDIGEVLRCTKDTARAHVFQAFRKIKKAMNGTDLPLPEPRR